MYLCITMDYVLDSDLLPLDREAVDAARLTRWLTDDPEMVLALVECALIRVTVESLGTTDND